MSDLAFNPSSWSTSENTIRITDNRLPNALQKFYDTLKLSGHFANNPTIPNNLYTKNVYDASVRIPVCNDRVNNRGGVRPTISLTNVPRRYLDFWTGYDEDIIYPACGTDITMLDYKPRLCPVLGTPQDIINYAKRDNIVPNRFWEITIKVNKEYPYGFYARYIGNEADFLSEFSGLYTCRGYGIYTGILGQEQTRLFTRYWDDTGKVTTDGTFADTFMPVRLQKTGGVYDDVYIPYMRTIATISTSGNTLPIADMISTGFMFCGAQYSIDSDIHFIYCTPHSGDFTNNPWCSTESGKIGVLTDMPYRLDFGVAVSAILASKSVWEDIFYGSGMPWSYDPNIVKSPDDGGLRKPNSSGQPDNPTIDIPGTGSNITHKVVYPTPSYIPNATVYDRYFLTPNQVPDVKKFLFSDTFVDNIKRLWTNPAEYVISLCCYPFDVYSAGLTTTTANVSVGGVTSDITAAAVTDRGIPFFYGGSVYVDNYYNSYLDYEPYTSIDIFIPYIGVRPLNVSQIVGHNLCIGYYIDLNTQQITALIGLDGDRGNLGQVVTQFVGSIGVQTPLSGTSAQDMIRNVVAQTSGLITGVGAIAGGVMSANPALISSGVANTANALLGGGHTAPSYYGSLSPVSGLYTPQTAYLIINRPRQAMPAAYLTQRGFSSNYSGKVSLFSGYLECLSAYVPCTDTMTAEEHAEIESLLLGGIDI